MATLILTVGASADDALIDDLAYDDTGTTRVWGGVSTTPLTNYGMGHRFTNVSLSSLDTVTSAYLALMAAAGGAGQIGIRLTCIDEDNTATFSSGSPPGARAIVTGSIADEDNGTARTSTVVYNYPEGAGPRNTLGAAVNAVIHRAGWAANNALAVVNNSDQDASAKASFARDAFHWYDSGQANSEPQLVITYSPWLQFARLPNSGTRPAAFKPGLAR